MIVIRILFFLAFFLYGNNLFEEGELWRVTADKRYAYFARAQIWRNVDIPNMDILAGPPSDIAVPPDAEVTCHYIEPHGPSIGHSPKFKCKGSKETLRIKFGSGEAPAEVAGTRLLWALGFYADYDYPIRLKCYGCPEKNPAHPSREEKRTVRLLKDTIMERDFPGEEIGEYRDQGWNWQELDQVDEKSGGATRAQIDALKLLAVFIQHTDSKPEQQRLACYYEDIDTHGKTTICKKPVLMVQDLGETFGVGSEKITEASAMNLRGWSNQEVWNRKKEAKFTVEHKGPVVCIGNLTAAKFAKKEGLTDPVIGEAGRAFLARLLNQLSDIQIRNLFRVARADKRGEQMVINGHQRAVTIEDWVSVFKKKRHEINDRRCAD